MEKTKGLKEYISSASYREAMGLLPQVEETYTLLAQGEYNRNYYFVHPVTKKELLLRVNFGSQMHLPDQIQYEYDALCMLKNSGRTPMPIYVDGNRDKISYGIMVMEYLPGHALDYRTELLCAAECLADIHSVPVPEKHRLIIPDHPLRAILEECEAMFAVYAESKLGDARKKRKIRSMLDMGWERVKTIPSESVYHCCINTELNSTNFLINGPGKRNYLIDWEKPLYGEPAQDLGHFLAPTTTFWKTDAILSEQEMDGFIEAYMQAAGGRFDRSQIRERTYLYIPITCLRGITWCAMAWIDYQNPHKGIFNESTYRKLQAYLEDEFLNYISEFILQKS